MINGSISPRFRFLAFAAFAFLCCGLCSAPSAHAQAAPIETRPADIFVFGGFNYTLPDYGQANQTNKGVTYGGLFQRYLFIRNIPLSAGIEARGTYTTGPVVAENTFTGGLRLGTTVLRRYHPYFTAEIGHGNIDYDFDPIPGYSHDDGTIYDAGGGVDIDVYRNFGLVLDGQSQNWHLGGAYTLSPAAITVGIRYRVPFAPWISHGHERQ